MPGDRFAGTQELTDWALNTSQDLLHAAVQNDEPGVRLLERTGDGFRRLPSAVLGEPTVKVMNRIISGAAVIQQARGFVDQWLEYHQDPDIVPDATGKSILSTVTELGELFKVENDFMVESSNQARRTVQEMQEMLDANPDSDDRIMRIGAETVFSHELEALIGNDPARRARLSDMMRLSGQIAPAMLEHIVEAVLERLRSTPEGLQRMHQLQDAALLQQEYERYASVIRQAALRDSSPFPLQPLKIVAEGLARVTLLPNGKVVPRDPILRKNCPEADRNINRVQYLFLEALLGESANLRIVTPHEEVPAYEAFWSARQAILASAAFAMTRILDTFIEQTRPQH